MYSLHVPLGYEYINQNSIDLWFTPVYDDSTRLVFDSEAGAFITFDFVEGRHA